MDKPPGKFLSIVHDYCVSRDNTFPSKNAVNNERTIRTDHLALPSPQQALNTEQAVQALNAEQTAVLEEISKNAAAKEKQMSKDATRKNKKFARIKAMSQEEQKLNYLQPEPKTSLFERSKSALQGSEKAAEEGEFTGWFTSALEGPEITLKHEKSEGRLRPEPLNMLQDYAREDKKTRPETRASTLRRSKSASEMPRYDFTHKHKRNSMSSDLKKGISDASVEQDPGMIGTEIVSVNRKYHLEEAPVEVRKFVVTDREGAYGYFREDRVEAAEHGFRKDLRQGEKESQLTESGMRRKGTEYRDESGELLYRTPDETQ